MEHTDPETTQEIIKLRREIALLNSHRFVKIHNSLPRLLMFQFVRGLAFGLGTVIGATILVSMLGLFLARIDFVPIIGEWASQIAEQIKAPN